MFKNFWALVGILFASSDVRALRPNPAAPQGGHFYYNLANEPLTLHPFMSTDEYSKQVRNFIGDSLLVRDLDTLEWKPRLAEKYDISKDGKVFTFYLRKGAVFHDGKPVTAADVKFSFDALFEPRYKAFHILPFVEGLSKVEVVNSETIKAYAKDNYFKNFESIAQLEIIPQHVYSDVKASMKMARAYVGAGPYKLLRFKKGEAIQVQRFDKWYGNKLADFKGQFNFANISFLFVKDPNKLMEKVRRGEMDFFELLPEAYVQSSEDNVWGKLIFKKKIENQAPQSYGYIGWNLRRELFQDKNLRLALASLLDREEMNKKFKSNLSELARGPVYNRSEYASSQVQAIPFDRAKATELLTKSGWKDSDDNGILDKMMGGKKQELKFSLTHANRENEKYWQMYKEDLKTAGIVMDIKYLEWAVFDKTIEDGNFDGVALAWSDHDIDWDPKQIWHSKSAVTGGSNFIGYKNPEVDRLIDEARRQGDRKKRVSLLKQVYEKIASDAPYAFLFTDKYQFYAVSNRVGQPGETFKYDIGVQTWWMTASPQR